jgi:hypothetical protein
MKIKFKCKDNDVKLQFHFVDGEIDEVWVKVAGEKSWITIGFKDFMNGIAKAKKKSKMKHNECYSKEVILKAAEIGEVSMIDARHIVNLLDEADQ